MSMIPKRQMVLDLIGWNLSLLAFICFLYVATVQSPLTIPEMMPLLVPIIMVIGGLLFGLGTKSIKTDVWLSMSEFLEGILWFIVVFGAIATVHVGVVQALSQTPFSITYDILDLKLYGVLIGQAEEIMFRGFLLVWFSTLGYPLGPYIGIPASAGAWTLFHLAVYGTQPLGLLLVFMVGIIVGFIAWYKPRLWVFMGAHALVNFVAMGGPTLLTTLLPAILVSVVIMLWVFGKKRR